MHHPEKLTVILLLPGGDDGIVLKFFFLFCRDFMYINSYRHVVELGLIT